MGKLMEYRIKALYGGVSRQPEPWRQPHQLQNADNVMPSILQGGFEKRPAAQHVATLGLATGTTYAMHMIDRSKNDKFLVVFGDDDGGSPAKPIVRVYDLLTGAAQTVATLTADAETYLTVSDPHNLAFVTVADYTFVANREKTVAMKTATGGTISYTVQTFAALPASPTTGQIAYIEGDTKTEAGQFYVQWTGSVWTQISNPTEPTDLNEETMPYILYRDSGGTWHFTKNSWRRRKVGDATSVPEPSFVGKEISAVVFFRGRLGLIADEYACFSQAGDVFNFWPDKVDEVLDSDPVELQATTRRVNLLYHATHFRNSLIVTSDSQQFEITADGAFTPTTAQMNPTTSYKIDTLCPPVTMGDALYFAAEQQGWAQIFEYFYDGQTYSNTAEETTKHCSTYIPFKIRQMATSSQAERVFVLPEFARNYLYVYTSYWQGSEKVQSAWTNYRFGAAETNAYIHSIGVIEDYLWMVVERNASQICIEKVGVEREPNNTGMTFNVLLDRRTTATGVYDPVNNWTTWTLPYNHNDQAQGILGGDFTYQAGNILNLTYPTGTTCRTTGDWSGGPVYFGKYYEMSAELSKQYPRTGDDVTVITGRLQLRDISIHYRSTGYFEIEVTPEYRDSHTYKFTGRTLGASVNMTGITPISQGVLKARVQSRADTVRIKIKNNSHLPSIITGGAWVGMYSNPSIME